MPTSTRETIAGSDDLSQLWDGFAKACGCCAWAACWALRTRRPSGPRDLVGLAVAPANGGIEGGPGMGVHFSPTRATLRVLGERRTV
jgi:hypothetical protein